MKSYHLEFVQSKNGSGLLGEIAGVAAIGAGVYYGYKYLTNENKYEEFEDSRSVDSYDKEAHEGQEFTDKILNAIKRGKDIIKK